METRRADEDVTGRQSQMVDRMSGMSRAHRISLGSVGGDVEMNVAGAWSKR